MAGNPDASRSFAGRASDAPVPRGPSDRDGSSGSADRQRAGRDIAPPAHSRRHSRSGHGRSSCRSAPERGNAYTRTAGPALAPAQARPHMDDVRNAWNNAPACVLGTVWGTASIRTWRFRSAPCLPIRQVVTAPLCARYTPSCRRARARLWVCGQRKSVVHIPTGATTNNQHQFDYFGIAGLRPSPSHPGERQSRQPSHITSIAPPSLRGFRQPFTDNRARPANAIWRRRPDRGT